MDHSAHDIMDHSGHDMDHSAHGMDHSSHGMDHSGHHGHDMAGMAMGNGTGIMHSMKMYFHFSYLGEYVLFLGWQMNSVGALIGSMIGVYLMAVLYEGLKYYREYLFRQAVTRLQASHTHNKGPIPIEDKPIQYMDQVLMASPLHIWSRDHLLQTALHMAQFILSYFLMLIFMTYQAWLCIAMILGAGTGYFAFGWRKSVMVDVTEHCH